MKTKILFNGDCPICNAEICHYRDYAGTQGIAMGFDDLNQVDPTKYGITHDLAAKRLHVLHEGKLISGVAAFEEIWKQLPRYHWLAKLVATPILKQLSHFVYDYILAPALYAMHVRRQNRTKRP